MKRHEREAQHQSLVNHVKRQANYCLRVVGKFQLVDILPEQRSNTIELTRLLDALLQLTEKMDLPPVQTGEPSTLIERFRSEGLHQVR